MIFHIVEWPFPVHLHRSLSCRKRFEQACRRDVRMQEVNVLIPEKLQPGEQLLGQIRSGGRATGCTVVEVGPEAVLVEFDEAQFAPCPGQRLVLYDEKDFVVAGGTIDYGNTDRSIQSL